MWLWQGFTVLIRAGINQSGESEPLRLCINYAGKSHDESVIRMIIDYLIGETDGEPKDFKYLFRLYMSLKRYREAAKTAVIISAEEQNMGNYKNAHELLFGMSYELKKQNLKIPNEMISSLMLIHSYMLAKVSWSIWHCQMPNDNVTNNELMNPDL